MNKRANLYLNIGEFVFFFMAFFLMQTYLHFHQASFVTKSILFLGGAVSGLLFIAIELFLFLLMNTKTRIIYCLFLGIDLILAVFINSIYPFSFIILFLIFCVLKNSLRIVLVNQIYIPREFNYYCRMFGISIKDFKKKKVARKVVKKKKYIEIPVEEPVKETKPKKRKKAVEEAI